MSYLRYLCRVFFFFGGGGCLVYPMLSVSLGCPFLITPSVFSNFYLRQFGKKYYTFERVPKVNLKIVETKSIHLTHIYMTLSTCIHDT